MSADPEFQNNNGNQNPEIPSRIILKGPVAFGFDMDELSRRIWETTQAENDEKLRKAKEKYPLENMFPPRPQLPPELMMENIINRPQLNSGTQSNTEDNRGQAVSKEQRDFRQSIQPPQYPLDNSWPDNQPVAEEFYPQNPEEGPGCINCGTLIGGTLLAAVGITLVLGFQSLTADNPTKPLAANPMPATNALLLNPTDLPQVPILPSITVVPTQILQLQPQPEVQQPEIVATAIPAPIPTAIPEPIPTAIPIQPAEVQTQKNFVFTDSRALSNIVLKSGNINYTFGECGSAEAALINAYYASGQGILAPEQILDLWGKAGLYQNDCRFSDINRAMNLIGISPAYEWTVSGSNDQQNLSNALDQLQNLDYSKQVGFCLINGFNGVYYMIDGFDGQNFSLRDTQSGNRLQRDRNYLENVNYGVLIFNKP